MRKANPDRCRMRAALTGRHVWDVFSVSLSVSAGLSGRRHYDAPTAANTPTRLHRAGAPCAHHHMYLAAVLPLLAWGKSLGKPAFAFAMPRPAPNKSEA